VTSGGIRCSTGTPIIKKPNLSLFIKEGTTKEEKNKSLDIEQIYGHGLDVRNDRADWLPAVSYCSAPLCCALLNTTALARASSMFKRQTRSIVREDAQQNLTVTVKQ
jgi:hypothetical protein